MADQELVDECTGKLERVIDRSVNAYVKGCGQFPGKTKKQQAAAKAAFGEVLKGFALTGVQIAVNALMVEDGRVNPHILGEAVKAVAAKHEMTIVPV